MQFIQLRSMSFVAVLVLLSVLMVSFVVFQNENDHNSVSFLLTDQQGKEVTHQDLADKSMLVFFGFTSCDDVCPVGMVQLSSIMKRLNNGDTASSFTPVFISVDPERDTPERLASYLGGFDQEFVGLTGSRTALENVAGKFNTFLDEPPEHHSGVASHHSTEHQHDSTQHSHEVHAAADHLTEDFIENYQLRHSSVIYLVDRNSQVVDLISLDEKIDVIVSRLREYVTSSEKSYPELRHHG